MSATDEITPDQNKAVDQHDEKPPLARKPKKAPKLPPYRCSNRVSPDTSEQHQSRSTCLVSENSPKGLTPLVATKDSFQTDRDSNAHFLHGGSLIS